MGCFRPIFQSALGGGDTKFFLVFFLYRASATKTFARSRIFKYGLPKDIYIYYGLKGYEKRVNVHFSTIFPVAVIA